MPPRTAQPDAQDNQAGPSAAGRYDGGRFPDHLRATVVQIFLKQGFILEQEAKIMIKRILNTSSDETYKQMLEAVNNSLEVLEMSVERTRLPANKDWYVCLRNKEKADEAAKLGTKYSLEQLAYFRAVLEAICEDTVEGGPSVFAEVASTRLLNASLQPSAASQAGEAGPSAPKKKITLPEKESTLEQLRADGWLFCIKTGYFTIGPRSMVELRELLLSAVPDAVAETLRQTYM